jgi:hypothetical protein
MPSLLADNDGVLLREVGEWRIRALHAALKLPAAVREIRISPRHSPHLLLLSAASPADFVGTVLVSL